MKTFLPNYTKKIGIIIYLIAVIISCFANIDSFLEGFYSGANIGYQNSKTEEFTPIPTPNYVSDRDERNFTIISLALSITGLLMYIFSKEKIEDEFIQSLRIKAITWSIVACWIAVFFLKLVDLQIEAIYILQFQLVAYIAVFVPTKKWANI